MHIPGKYTVTKIDLAESIMLYAHTDQVDEGGHPYYWHPVIVASHMETEEEKVVALLHDVVEKSAVSLDTIGNLFGSRVMEAVSLLTLREGESYLSYINRLSRDPLARKVKLAEIDHNMDTGRLGKLTYESFQRREKYRMAREILLTAEAGT